MTEPTELFTERMLLRPWSVGDVDDLLAYAADPVWAENAPPGFPRPFTRRHAEEFVARNVLSSWETAPVFAIVIDSIMVGDVKVEIDATNQIGHWGTPWRVATGARD